MRSFFRRNIHVGLPLKHQDDVRSPELEVRNLVPLGQHHAFLCRQHDRRHLGHSHRQHRNQTHRRLHDYQAPILRELVARRVGRIELLRGTVHAAIRYKCLHALGTGDGDRIDFQVHITLDVLGPDDFPAERAMLAMIVVGPEEAVHEHATLELLLIGTVLEEFADVPV